LNLPIDFAGDTDKICRLWIAQWIEKDKPFRMGFIGLAEYGSSNWIFEKSEKGEEFHKNTYILRLMP
jgi:hypothetical protein